MGNWAHIENLDRGMVNGLSSYIYQLENDNKIHEF